MQPSRKAPFRIGGTRGEWKLVFGEWAELGETLLPLTIYVCPKCGRVKLFADEKTKQFLLTTAPDATPNAFLKKCVNCGKQIPIASEQCQYCKSKQPKFWYP
jgi:predicted RNA-binding Zn-ribbon protein involved in translation (DUF1610 family)